MPLFKKEDKARKKIRLLLLIFLFYSLFVLLLTFLDQWTKIGLTKWPRNWRELLAESNNQRAFAIEQEPRLLVPWMGLYAYSVGHPKTTFTSYLNIPSPTWLSHFFSVIVILASLFALFKKRNISTTFITALISAGSLGNMIDRVLFEGTVRDVFIFSWGFGVFNLADFYIAVSVLLIILSMLRVFAGLKILLRLLKKLIFKIT